MANKKGTGRFMVWVDVPADKEAEFNGYYNEEHLAELLAVPGVLNAARYEAVSSGPKHLACYELESPAVIETDAFKNRQPTERSLRAGPRGVGARIIRRRKSLTPICHCSRDRSISLTPITNPSQFLRAATSVPSQIYSMRLRISPWLWFSWDSIR